MLTNNGKIWALVPARGGSKSIPYKNLVPLAGRPLLDYGVLAAKACERLDRIICSTEDDNIAERARTLGIEIDRRPISLAGDMTKVEDVVREMLARLSNGESRLLPDILVLIQPTSPFLCREHIDAVLDAMLADPQCRSGQNITPIPHNHHAFNQRSLEKGRAILKFENERRIAYNKQSKEPLYGFGNLYAARAEAILDGDTFFASPAVATVVPRPYNFDLDGPSDIPFAEAILGAGLVKLPHLDEREAYR